MRTAPAVGSRRVKRARDLDAPKRRLQWEELCSGLAERSESAVGRPRPTTPHPVAAGPREPASASAASPRSSVCAFGFPPPHGGEKTPTNVKAKSSPASCPAPTSVAFPRASAGESAGEPVTVYLPVGDVEVPVHRVNTASTLTWWS